MDKRILVHVKAEGVDKVYLVPELARCMADEIGEIFGHSILVKLMEGGLPAQYMYFLRRPGGKAILDKLNDQMTATAVSLLQNVDIDSLEPTTSFVVEVDYDETLGHKIHRAGDAGIGIGVWADMEKSFICDRRGKAKLIMEAVYFDRPMTLIEGHAELVKMGLRPAEAIELVEFVTLPQRFTFDLSYTLVSPVAVTAGDKYSYGKLLYFYTKRSKSLHGRLDFPVGNPEYTLLKCYEEGEIVYFLGVRDFETAKDECSVAIRRVSYDEGPISGYTKEIFWGDLLSYFSAPGSSYQVLLETNIFKKNAPVFRMRDQMEKLAKVFPLTRQEVTHLLELARTNQHHRMLIEFLEGHLENLKGGLEG